MYHDTFSIIYSKAPREIYVHNKKICLRATETNVSRICLNWKKKLPKKTRFSITCTNLCFSDF